MKARVVLVCAVAIGFMASGFGQAPEGAKAKPAKADPIAAAHKAALAELRAGVLGLAEWCAKQKLFREQTGLLETLLAAWCLAACVAALRAGFWSWAPWPALFAAGFAAAAMASWRDLSPRGRSSAGAAPARG